MSLRFAPAALLVALATGAQAHPGHGVAAASHWHATDVIGFVVAAVLAGIAFWFFNKD